MEVISRRSSNLNPYAPIFVPLAYQTVEDFSDEWWALIQSSPSFHEYWLRERFSDDNIVDDDSDFVFPDDLDGFIVSPKDEEKEAAFTQELMPIGAPKWERGRSATKSPRYVEKAPKIVNVKVSPRTIHQPR